MEVKRLAGEGRGGGGKTKKKKIKKIKKSGGHFAAMNSKNPDLILS